MVIFWSLSLLFLCLLLHLSLPFMVRKVVHPPWFVRPRHLDVVVALGGLSLLSRPLLTYVGTATPSNASRAGANTDWDTDTDDIQVASPSDAAYTGVDSLIGDETLMNIDDFENLKCDDLLRYILYKLVAIRDSFGGPDLVSSSDATLSSLEDAQDVSGLEEDPTDITPMDAPIRSARSVSVFDDYVNVLRYDVSISGQECILLFPPKHADSFHVDGQGRLFSISANTIQGRLVDGNFSPYAQIGKFVYLTPCPDNNFYITNEYDSPNYVREHYWSSDGLRHRDAYANTQVSQHHHILKVSDTFAYIVVVLMGGCLICLWRKSSRWWGMLLSSSTRSVMSLVPLLSYGLWISLSISLYCWQTGGNYINFGIAMKVVEWMFHELSFLFDILWRHFYWTGMFVIGLPFLKKVVDIFRWLL